MPNGLSGQAGTRPKLGFRPKMPVKPAGMRIDPPPSVPTCKAPMPSAQATAAPPLEPPGVLRDVPRIARDAGERAVGDRLPAELGRGRLADQHRALLAQPRGRRRVLVPGLIARDRAAAAQGRPAPGQQQVLDRGRHAVDQAGRRAAPPAVLGCARIGQRALSVDQAERVDRAIEPLDPVEHGARHLDRRQPSAAIVSEQLGRAEGRGIGHGGHPLRDWRGRTSTAPVGSVPVSIAGRAEAGKMPDRRTPPLKSSMNC